jgi:hypothetical protein
MDLVRLAGKHLPLNGCGSNGTAVELKNLHSNNIPVVVRASMPRWSQWQSDFPANSPSRTVLECPKLIVYSFLHAGSIDIP